MHATFCVHWKNNATNLWNTIAIKLFGTLSAHEVSSSSLMWESHDKEGEACNGLTNPIIPLKCSLQSCYPAMLDPDFLLLQFSNDRKIRSIISSKLLDSNFWLFLSVSNPHLYSAYKLDNLINFLLNSPTGRSCCVMISNSFCI